MSLNLLCSRSINFIARLHFMHKCGYIVCVVRRLSFDGLRQHVNRLYINYVMKRVSRIFDCSDEGPIFLIVPGFLGNFSEGFVPRLFKELVALNKSVVGIVFRGHESYESGLASTDEMVEQTKLEYAIIRASYPKRKIIIVAHSQGCAIIMKISSMFDELTSLRFVAPALFLDKIILSRVSEEDMNNIESGEYVRCELAQNKYRIVGKEWVSSYKKFSDWDLVQPCLLDGQIIRGNGDYIPKDNAMLLRQKCQKCAYIEIPGDHIFVNPSNSFDVLINTIVTKT